MTLGELLATALADHRAATGTASASVRDLLAAARGAGGARVPRSLVERTLRDDPRFVADGDPGKARWRLADRDGGSAGSGAISSGATSSGAISSGATSSGATSFGAAGPAGHASAHDLCAAVAAVPPAEPASGTRGHLAAMALRPWQADALAAWSGSCRGVVEAVTGTGKTRLAMAAIRVVVDRGGRALVLVPTLELQEQWVRELRAAIPGLAVGRLGGGRDDDLFGHEVVVATPHSAAAVPVDLPPGAPGLLVADEAHRYGAPTWGAALKDDFVLRLALTATYERGDDGLVEVLAPYFGEVVVRYGYDRAVADGTVAPFRIALAGVRLEPAERDAYDRADARVRQLHRELVGGLGMPKDPAALFAAVAAVVADGEAHGHDGAQVRACREYLARVRERRDVAATSVGKLRVCELLAPALAGRRTLVFTDTVDQAEAAVRRLGRAGLAAETVHGGLPADRRRIRLARFRRGDLDALVAPRVLDEGIDVPDADVAVVLAAFRTRRQMVQRLGRVLRLKGDGRAARLVLAHAIDTREDPAHGGHDDFLRAVRDVAVEVARVDVDAAPGALAGWLGTRHP
jgi:superfamily II DNA or RNA helicase